MPHIFQRHKCTAQVSVVCVFFYIKNPIRFADGIFLLQQ
ncbi:hypothetical protein Y11_17581 [Yersinia enterocolitica subsp. palearctica Y11]|uniref:Uncharacterized protein n=1 Tax=Yersinia enterocolitica subsp. palearctica serotype O:3 (strain DSM 13030 / CIP 106945 / Y11) TaxID=930944 RepID=A0A0H3NMW6_YERE1|nr:hypothetical protein Y11_17581 [Yersinia enterocolitica subsp. palearctica Y11]